jgi:hypothetical protein
MTMGRAEWGKLTQAWPGEATDFTPKLAAQLDVLGEAIGVDLIPDADTEVLTTGGRRIDIVGTGGDDVTYVVENQYGRADHDHLTRGLAYAVAKSAAGLIVIAEEHRDEFRSVAHYLNHIAARAGEGGIKIWLVEAKAIRVNQGPWAPIFTAVAEPSAFVEAVARDSRHRRSVPIADLLDQIPDPAVRSGFDSFIVLCDAGPLRLKSTGTALGVWAAGPSTGGERAVVSIYPTGAVMVPFGAYAGTNTGTAIPPLDSIEFQDGTVARLHLRRTKAFGTSPDGWLTAERADELHAFCLEVAGAYANYTPPAERENS